MGLLDGFPDGWLGLLRDQAPNWNGIGANTANDAQPLTPQPQRLPLSLAGPSLTTNYPNRELAQLPTRAPFGPFPDGLGAAPSNHAADRQTISQSPAPRAQNLTAQVLLAKGVSEPDVAAAIGNPELMKQLINQNFGPGSAASRSGIGYATYSNSASGDPSAHSTQGADGQPNGFNNGRVSRATPPSNQFTPPASIGYGSSGNPYATALPENSRRSLEESPAQLAQVFALPPISLFARPPVYVPRQLTPLENLPKGSANGPRAGMKFPRNEGKLKAPDEYPPCTYCGEKTGPGRFHRDHIIPRSRGGDGAESNRAPACPNCNLSKGPRTPEEWYIWLKNGGI